MKTSELTGAALDWAVAQAEGNVRLQYDSREGLIINNVLGWIPYRPSAAWQQGGPIIDREDIAISSTPDGLWRAYAADETMLAPHGDVVFKWKYKQHGYHPLIAAMRCYVASKLGDEIEIPEELK